MNNNIKKPDNEKNDSENISTKKGFRLSLPGKKNSGEIKSTIHFSAPQNAQNNGAAQPSAPVKNDKGENKNSHSDSFKKTRGDKEENRNNKENRGGRFRDKDRNKNANSGSADDRKTDRDDKNRKNANSDRQPGSQGGFQKKRNDRNEKNGANKNRAPQNNAAKDENTAQNDRNQQGFKNKNRPQKNQSEQNAKGTKDNRKNEQKNGKKENSNRNQPSRTPLSALSGDMQQSLAAIKEHKRELEAAKPKVKELSLEEKYKDAIPLAEKIAAEDEKARHPIYGSGLSDDEKQEIVGIRFREAGKIYYFDPDGQTIPYGTHVIVETARGSEYGFTAISNRLIPKEGIVSPLKKIQRIATEMDTQKYTANKMLEKQAAEVFKEKVAALGLAMNLIYVEYTFDNSKLLFYFTAETRIDFRELVKELAGVFRTRIELRQIGVRDEAKVLGGLGVCGRAACCATFLGDFAQVSIKMAKDQNLSLSAAKISGACGKLMCCLRYEDKVYEQENARTPKVGALVETSEGKGVVTERNALKGTVGVVLDASPDSPAKTFDRDAVTVLGFSGKAAAEDQRADDNADEIKDDEQD